MYIVIFEDGEVQSSPTCDEDLLLGADDGVVDLLDVSDPENPMRRWDGEWQPIESVVS